MTDAIRRRTFLQSSLIGAGCLLPGMIAVQQKPAQTEHEEQNEGEEISPAEDLMREHGLLNRILLIYDHHVQLLSAKKTFDGSILVSSADIIRQFVEEYHEKLEEDYFVSTVSQGKEVSVAGRDAADSAQSWKRTHRKNSRTRGCCFLEVCLG